MKFRTITVVAASFGILLAATACSSGSGGTGSASSPSASKTAAAAAKTYTASDLPPILTTAEKSLGISGTVLDNAQVQAKLKDSSAANPLSQLLAQPGASLTPAACATELKNDLTIQYPADRIGSILTYGTNAVTLASLESKTLPSSLTTDAFSKVDTLVSKCGTMKLSVTKSGQTVAADLTIKKIDVTTDADKTTGISEVVSVPSPSGGTPITETVQVVDAVSGNLLIATESATSSTASSASSAASPSAADVINAVIAAAKK